MYVASQCPSQFPARSFALRFDINVRFLMGKTFKVESELHNAQIASFLSQVFLNASRSVVSLTLRRWRTSGMDGNGERGGWALIGSDPVTMDVAGYNQDGGAGRDNLLVFVCACREYVVLRKKWLDEIKISPIVWYMYDKGLRCCGGPGAICQQNSDAS